MQGIINDPAIGIMAAAFEHSTIMEIGNLGIYLGGISCFGSLKAVRDKSNYFGRGHTYTLVEFHGNLR